MRSARVALHANPGLESCRSWAAFLREALANPRAVGALVPSSPALSRRITELVGWVAEGLVVELGAGTGVVTAELLRRCVPAQRLILVERAPALVGLLRRRFPDLTVLCGDAADLRRMLARLPEFNPRRVSHIVSSLPLRSLPPAKVDGILREVGHALQYGGHLVQYTYALASRNWTPPGFEIRRSALVWRNVPPARVDLSSPRDAGPASLTTGD